MKVCLVSPEHSPWGGIGHSIRRLAELLATRHEVTVVHSGGDPGRAVADAGVREVVAEFGDEVARTAFACEDHQRSAAVLEAIERAYGSAGPDYVEVPDFRGHGLVTLQARRAGHPLLRDTLIAVSIRGSSELLCLHDGSPDRPAMRFVADLEREQLRLADRLIWAGGDALDLYRRFYSGLALPEPVRIRRPLPVPAEPPAPPPRESGRPLRILYAGRLQRAKGALDLAEACKSLPGDDWELKMVGADTPTASLGQSAQMAIEAMCGEDPRMTIEPPLPHAELQGLWGQHDLLALPSRFEVWSNVGLEAMRAGLPILATPVGGSAELVEPGVTGWHTDGLGADSLRRALCRLLEDREEVERVRASGDVFERFRRLADPGEILAGYERLLGPGARRPAAVRSAPAGEPLVSGIVPYYRGAEFIEEAVASLLAQTHRNLEVLIVNDGSFEQSDAVLDELAADPRVQVIAQLNHGESAARNLAARLARGEYLAVLDGDNLFEPEFVARALELLRHEPELAYATCWLSYVAPDGAPLAEAGAYAPLGNSVLSSDSDNWDGDAIAVLPRRLFSELGYAYDPTIPLHSDWEFYRRLRRDGRFGAVIPERLAKYRVHPSSLTKTHDGALHERAHEEEIARRALRAIRWTAET